VSIALLADVTVEFVKSVPPAIPLESMPNAATKPEHRGDSAAILLPCAACYRVWNVQKLPCSADSIHHNDV
jgi:hypothetical protein